MRSDAAETRTEPYPEGSRPQTGRDAAGVPPGPPAAATAAQGDDQLLGGLQRDTFAYFIHEVNRTNGLIRDKACRERSHLLAGWPSSIAAVGVALAAYPVGVERG